MAQYTAIFTKPYADGYENLPSQNTPITAQTLNDKDDALVNIETYLSGNDIPSDAEGLSYDNTDSGLTADNVQSAIDEIVMDIPTVNNGTLTIQKNGEDVATFTANQSGNSTANLQVKEPDCSVKTNTTGQFNTITGGILESCDVKLEPIQDLHGYTKPWVGGSGKNKLQNTHSGTVEQHGLKITSNDDGSVFFHGGYTASAIGAYDLSTTQDIPNGSYILNGCPSGGGGTTFQISINDKNDTGLTNSFTDTGSGANVTISNGGVYRPRVVIRQGYTIPSDGLLFKPMLRLSTISDATFEPYTNICPITGHSSVEIDVTDEDSNTTQYTISLGQTVYGGTLDVVSGSGSDEWANIASYSGETITEPWLSSMDEYTSGGTPTTGAQVVYKKATTSSLSTTPQQIETLIGENNISVPLTGQSLDSLSYREMMAWDDVETALEPKADISAIGTDESGRTTASQAYAIGENFYKDGKFCTAITSIASGATLTLNTNYVEGTIADNIRTETKTATVTSGITWLTITDQTVIRQGRVVSFSLVVTISNMPTLSGSTNIIDLPFIMEGKAKFVQMNNSSDFEVNTHGLYIASDTKNIKTRGQIADGGYYISGTYICKRQ